MAKSKFMSAALLGAVVLAAPAMARESHVTSRAAASATFDAPYIVGQVCHPAPRVGAFATQPWDNGNVPCEPASDY
jgi:hypothetical protein